MPPARYGEHEPMVVSTELGDLSVLPNRRLHTRRVFLNRAQDFAPVGKAVRIGTGIRVPR